MASEYLDFDSFIRSHILQSWPPSRPIQSTLLSYIFQLPQITTSQPYVTFSANQTPPNTQKDTVRNVKATGVFVWNLATYVLHEAVNATAEQVEYGADKSKKAGLKKQAVKLVEVEGEKIPMVEDSPVDFECAYYSTIRLSGSPPMGPVDVVIGEVVGIHIKEVLTDGKIDVRKTQPIARCGYYEYAVVDETFEMIVPGD